MVDVPGSIRELHQPAPRSLEVIVGGLSFLLGLGIAVLGGVALWYRLTVVRKDAPSYAWLVVILAAAALISGTCMVLGARLLRGRGRRDGQSLLSPWALRIAAVFSASVPLVILAMGFVRPGQVDLWRAIGSLGVGIGVAAGCWTLARLRGGWERGEEADSPGPSGAPGPSPAGAGPLPDQASRHDPE